MASEVNGRTNPLIPTNIRLSYRGTITEFDRQIISHHILDTEKELKGFDTQLKKLNAEINRLKGAVILVESHREMVEQQLANYRSLLSPIHKMPPEIMTEIFKLCCSCSKLGFYNLFDHTSLPPPMMLSSVCGRWRELVLDTPALWASLTAHNFYVNPDLTMYRAIEFFMERSKSAPLAIDSAIHDDDDDGPNHGEDFLEPLVQNSRRWVSLDLFIAPSGFQAQIFQRLRGQIPLLKHLGLRSVITVPRPIMIDSTSPFLAAFELAPSLQSVTLTGHLATPLLALPWHQIESIRLELSVDAILSILRQCHTVEQITLRPITGELSHTGSCDLLAFAREISIILRSSSLDALSGMLEHLTLPGLESVDLKLLVSPGFIRRHPPSGDVISILRNFLTRSSCSLTSLCLHHIPIDDVGLLSLLPLIPTLIALTIADGKNDLITEKKVVTNHFLGRLSLYGKPVAGSRANCSTPSTDVLIPHLQNLTFSISDYEDLDEKILVGTLASRLPDTSQILPGAQGKGHDTPASDRCLRSIDISLTVRNEKSFDALLSLECFRDAGVKVKITIFRLPATTRSSTDSVEESNEEDE
ncbi:hypothetical protein PQX77_009794 [Marasmius sp. AFHP31]|nr:hypothetical protein PQX77_009794 [Marasmius sp. AFHP31]